MKVFQASALVVSLMMFQTQTDPQRTPDVTVVKFSCGTYRPPSGMIRSVQDPDPPKNEPIRINQTQRNEPQEVTNRRDMQERRAELRAAEINAVLSNQTDSRVYFYRLVIKNTGNKIVKGFAWEYQPSNEPDPSNRQFFCVVKAKPNESREFELFTPLAPSRVVDASKAGTTSNNKPAGTVVINKIQYMDDAVWQRPGWNAATFSADAIAKTANGKCIGL